MKIKLRNQQTKLRISAPALKRLAQWILNETGLPALHGGEVEVDLLLTDDEGIQPLNRACFGKDRPTDVITQAYAAVPGRGGFHGEIVVNAQRAAEEGARRQGPGPELALYIAHGFDHLAGATDHTPAQRARMRRREQAWLKKAAAAGPLREGGLAL